MKILRIATTDGAPYGQVLLSMLVEGIDLKGGQYALSLRDEVFLGCLPEGTQAAQKKNGSFTLGEARAMVTEGLDGGGRRQLKIAVESADACDFAELVRWVYTSHLGIPHTDIQTPRHRLDDLSLVRSATNDIRRLGRFVKGRLRALKESMRGVGSVIG